jgi:hypothetical protein
MEVSMRFLCLSCLILLLGNCSSATSSDDGGPGTGGSTGNTGVGGSTGNSGAGGSGAGGSKGNTGAGGSTGNTGVGGSTGNTGVGGSGGNTGVGGSGASGSKGNTGAGGSSASGGSKGNTGAGGSTGNTGAGGSTVGGGTNPLTADVINAFVVAHNQARSGPLNPTPNPALPPVSWDPVLADSAYNYTAKCQGATGLLSHNANRSTDYQALGGSGYVGENIYGTTAKTTTPAAAVDAWMSEASQFDYATDNLTAAGHYTQVVWRTSVRIGCAIVDCPNLQFHETVLCDYAPGGNLIGQKPY